MVTSISETCGKRARTADKIASIDCADNTLGVPPPIKILDTRRPQTCGKVLSKSWVSAST